MQLNFGFVCVVLVGVIVTAAAAFRLDMDGMYSLDFSDTFAVGLAHELGPDYTRYLNIEQDQDQLEAANEEGEGKGKGKDSGKGKGNGKGGEGGEDASTAFESRFD